MNFSNMFGKSDSEKQLEKDFLEFKEMHKRKINEFEGRILGKEEFIKDLIREVNAFKIDSYNQSKEIEKLTRANEIIKETVANKVIYKFCEILNLFQMAKDSNAKTIDDLRHGVDLIIENFNKILEDFGVEKIGQPFEKFDPNFHEALYTESSDEVADGYIIRVFDAGYKKGDKIIKYAKVVVCSK